MFVGKQGSQMRTNTQTQAGDASTKAGSSSKSLMANGTAGRTLEFPAPGGCVCVRVCFHS